MLAHEPENKYSHLSIEQVLFFAMLAVFVAPIFLTNLHSKKSMTIKTNAVFMHQHSNTHSNNH